MNLQWIMTNRRRIMTGFSAMMIWAGTSACGQTVTNSSFQEITAANETVSLNEAAGINEAASADETTSRSELISGSEAVSVSAQNTQGSELATAQSASFNPQSTPTLFQLHKPSDGVSQKVKVKQEEKVVALTFDDGPDARYTPAILDILKANQVKATFFVVGTQVKRFPNVLKRINEEGHLIGNHTYHHVDLAKASKAKIMEEIGYNDLLIEQVVGFTPTIIRPPYGAITANVRADMEENGREVALWNIDTRDWAGTSVTAMRAKVNKSLKTQNVILMHSFGGTNIHHTVEVLPLIIKDLKNKGYTFVTYDELP